MHETEVTLSLGSIEVRAFVEYEVHEHRDDDGLGDPNVTGNSMTGCRRRTTRVAIPQGIRWPDLDELGKTLAAKVPLSAPEIEEAMDEINAELHETGDEEEYGEIEQDRSED